MPEDLTIVRQDIAEHAASFLKIVASRQFRRLFGNVEGERLSGLPRGFAAEHPAAEYLKHKQFLVGRTLLPAEATAPTFYSVVVETFRAMQPFVRFLNEPLVRARRVRDRQDALFPS